MGKFFEWLTGQAESLKMRTNVRNSVGTDIKRDIDKFKAEYENRKAGESFRIWRSKFDFVNKAMGGYVSSNVYVIYGKSGRGKSAVSLEEVTNCAMQGANVLIWSMEMGWYDYSIFLMDRFNELKKEGTEPAMISSMKNMGSVIISSAIILAGTFAAT